MNNRRKKRNHKIIIGVLSAFIVLSMFSFFIGRNQTSIEKFLSTSVQTVEYYIFKKPLAFVQGIFSEYYELKDVYEENAMSGDFSSCGSRQLSLDNASPKTTRRSDAGRKKREAALKRS